MSAATVIVRMTGGSGTDAFKMLPAGRSPWPPAGPSSSTHRLTGKTGSRPTTAVRGRSSPPDGCEWK
jgi:hypothetical protein